MKRNRGGIVGVVVIVAFFLLRFGALAFRMHEDGTSSVGIVESLVVIVLAVFVLLEVIFGLYALRNRARKRALAEAHSGARIEPVLFTPALRTQLTDAASMLGVTLERRIPRSGQGSLVADQKGIGLYRGGGTPVLVLGITRTAIAEVGRGTTASPNRYGFGQVEALRIVTTTGVHHVLVDVPLYATVIGFPRTLRGTDLSERVQGVAHAAGVRIGALAQP